MLYLLEIMEKVLSRYFAKNIWSYRSSLAKRYNLGVICTVYLEAQSIISYKKMKVEKDSEGEINLLPS